MDVKISRKGTTIQYSRYLRMCRDYLLKSADSLYANCKGKELLAEIDALN